MARIVNSRCVLAVRDLEVSTRYYKEVLGFSQEPIEAGAWSFLTRDTFRVMLGECANERPASELGITRTSLTGTLTTSTGSAARSSTVGRWSPQRRRTNRGDSKSLACAHLMAIASRAVSSFRPGVSNEHRARPFSHPTWWTIQLRKSSQTPGQFPVSFPRASRSNGEL
jgi:hypothetical protein